MNKLDDLRIWLDSKNFKSESNTLELVIKKYSSNDEKLQFALSTATSPNTDPEVLDYLLRNDFNIPSQIFIQLASAICANHNTHSDSLEYAAKKLGSEVFKSILSNPNASSKTIDLIYRKIGDTELTRDFISLIMAHPNIPKNLEAAIRKKYGDVLIANNSFNLQIT